MCKKTVKSFAIVFFHIVRNSIFPQLFTISGHYNNCKFSVYNNDVLYSSSYVNLHM